MSIRLVLCLALIVFCCDRSQAADWPCWRGPAYNGHAPDGPALSPDLPAAKRLWTSEASLPDTYVGDARKAVAKDSTGISGGYASPVIANGKVYQFIYRPSGTVVAEEIVAKHAAAGGWGAEKWLIDADDIVICMDAANGKTLWTRSFSQQGINISAGFNKGGGLLTPSVVDGRLYAIGSALKLYCIDAESGEPIWQGDLGPRAAEIEGIRKQSHADKKLPYFNRDLGSCPLVVGGLVICNDHTAYNKGSHRADEGKITRGGLIAHKADTGERAWHLPESIGRIGTPTPWQHGGKAYIVSSVEQDLLLIDAAEGKELWRVSDTANGGGTMPIAGDIVVCGGGGKKPGVGASAWRLGLDKPEKLWQLPPELKFGLCSPVIVGEHLYGNTKQGLLCVELATGKRLATAAHPGGGISSSLIAGGGLVIAESFSKTDQQLVGLIAFHAAGADTAATGPVWALPYANSVTPSLADGRLYVRTRDRLVCFGLGR